MTDRARYWRALVREQAGSGLTQAVFCRQRQVNAGTFAWWKRRLRADAVAGAADSAEAGRTRSVRSRRRTARPKPLRFMEVEWVGTEPKRYEIVLSGGRVLRVPTEFDSECVMRLIQAVESAC